MKNSNFSDLSISSKIMCDQALEMGIEVESLGDGLLLKMEKDGLEWYSRGSRTSVQSSVGKTIADNKGLSKFIIQENGFKTAKYRIIRDKNDIYGLERELVFPVVVKPLSGNQGIGVGVGLRSEEIVREHVGKHEDVDRWIVEELLFGEEYRVVCIDFKFVAAAKRIPAYVVGDGSSSLKELIDRKNSDPYRGTGHENYLTKIEIDDALEQTLKKKELRLDSVVENGERVEVRSVCNLSQGGEVENVTDKVSDKNRIFFETLSRVVDLNIIGIDVMCPSLERDVEDQIGSGIVEINASPGLMIHHTPYNPDNSENVAEKILEMTIRKLRLLKE